MTELQVKAAEAQERARHNKVEEQLKDRENWAKYNMAYTALDKSIDSAHNGNDGLVDVLHKLWFGDDNEQSQVIENFYHNADKWSSLISPLYNPMSRGGK